MAHLFTQDGRYIVGTGYFGALEPGLVTLDFVFYSRYIADAGLDGPYELRLLALGGKNLTTSAGNHVTYALDDLSAPA